MHIKGFRVLSFKEKTENQVRTALQELGGEIIPGKADLNALLPFLPRFPLYLSISARLLVDRCAAHYLTIEDAVTIGDAVVKLLMGN